MDETPPQRTDQPPIVVAYWRPKGPGPSAEAARYALWWGLAALGCLAVGATGLWVYGSYDVFGFLIIAPISAATAVALGSAALIRNAPRRRQAVAGIACGVAVIIPYSVLATIGLPRQFSQRRLTGQTACMVKLSRIGSAVATYRLRHQGSPPADLAALVNDGHLRAEDIRSPVSSGRRSCDYAYLAPRGTSRPERMVVACSLAGVHNGGRTALFADEHTEFLTDEEFAAILAEPPNAAFAKALEKAERP